jgi:outer membrane lipoprotein carrier protein
LADLQVRLIVVSVMNQRKQVLVAATLSLALIGGVAWLGTALQRPAPTHSSVELATEEPARRPEQASEVLLTVKNFYDGVSDLEASFEQYHYNPKVGESHEGTGKLEAKKPNKMIWDQRDDAGADYYTDGNTLWMVEHDTRKVTKTNVIGKSKLTAPLQWLFDGEKLLSEYEVDYADPEQAKRYGDADHHVLKLRPEAKSKPFKGLALVVDASTGRVDGLVVYNNDGSNNYYEFSDVRTNVGLEDGRFEFRLPADYVETVAN